MDRLQPIYDIAELCVRKEITHAILSPGSRCAPLTLAFTRHKKINCRTISDERSAAFIGLGIAQQTDQPAILLCTSGSAAYNFAPAIAEAFFSCTPLVVFTADRPTEWIGQHDGQAIYQYEMFGKHVKKSFQLPHDYEHKDSDWAINRIVNEAINLANQHPKGPVHINVPFREPLYPNKNRIQYSKSIRVIEHVPHDYTLTKSSKDRLKNEWHQYSKILVVFGQMNKDSALSKLMEELSTIHNLPIVADIISNQHETHVLKHSNLFLGQAHEKIKRSLHPDLLITVGGAVISKNLKLFLRSYRPKAHWHIQTGGIPADTFQHLTQSIETQPLDFFKFLKTLKPSIKNQKTQSDYQRQWFNQEQRTTAVLEKFFPQREFAELDLVHEIINQLPANANLHLANSMSVRYANFIGLSNSKNKVTVFSNRGTSGIDGCTSTAYGHALCSKAPNVLITGDLAFFYDRNAFWNNYPVPNLRVVLLNNHGGVIFKIIDGPASLPEAEEFFVTKQKLTAKTLCQEFGFSYIKVEERKTVTSKLKEFFTFDGSTKVLELESSSEINKTQFENLKSALKKSYES